MDVLLLNEWVTNFFALGTLGLHIFLAVFVVLLVINWQLKKKGQSLQIVSQIVDLNSKYILVSSFLLALAGMLGSLFYSDIVGLPPCKLCWTQRIFLYPQVFLFAVALKKKSKMILDYAIVLTIIGFIVALYQYGIQFIPALESATEGIVGCSLDPSQVSCSEYTFLKFGYITDTMMSITAFGMLFIMTIVHKYADRLR